MTREEAKKLFFKCKSDFVIDKIYDYFETRNCSNCEFSELASGDNFRCQKCVCSIDGYDDYIVDRNFYCNKYKKNTYI